MSSINEFNEKLINFEKQIKNFILPKFHELPQLELYMDQVIVLISQYFEALAQIKADEKIITSSMINNYVKLKIIPAPIKKRYSKVHLAYLIMVCSLKQNLNISDIQKMIPVNLDESEIERVYNSFIDNHNLAISNATQQLNFYSKQVSDIERINDLAQQVAISSNVFKLFNEMIIDFKFPAKAKKPKENKNEK